MTETELHNIAQEKIEKALDEYWDGLDNLENTRGPMSSNDKLFILLGSIIIDVGKGFIGEPT